jgi:hypothetical protein
MKLYRIDSQLKSPITRVYQLNDLWPLNKKGVKKFVLYHQYNFNETLHDGLVGQLHAHNTQVFRWND